MDDLTPPILIAVQSIRWHLASGTSVAESVRLYLEENHDPFARKLRLLWAAPENSPVRLTSSYQQSLWRILQKGRQGVPILEALTLLESETRAAAESVLDRHLDELPFKALIPLLLFQFPAFVLILVGPLLRDLQMSLGG
ncbi:MAG: hypothetical protein AB7F86_06350 [Bdellovibrionales bacterium]